MTVERFIEIISKSEIGANICETAMANNEHLKILRQGIEEWNKWREQNPEIKPNLSRADLSNMSLTGGIFREANISWANLSGADLSWVFLDNADLTKANLTNADLSEANLSEANLYRADLTGANLYRVYLNKANLESAILREANLREANLTETNLRLTHLRKADFSRANLTNANLGGAYLDETIFEEADLTRANLYRVEQINVDFSSAKLEKTNFKYPNPRRRRLIWGGIVVLGFIAVISLIILLWNKFHGDLVIVVPNGTRSYVFLDENQLSPGSNENGEDYYYAENYLTGDYTLRVYSTQLKDIQSYGFTRHKLYQRTVSITNQAESTPHFVRFDTLYTVQHIVDGIYPDINPEGSKLIYIKIAEGASGRPVKQLYTFDLVNRNESKVAIDENPYPEWDFDWELDRIYLSGNDKYAYVSAFQYSADKPSLFRIDLENSKLTAITLKTGKKWLSIVPVRDENQFLFENTIYSIDGRRLKTYMPDKPYENRLYFGGKNGVIFIKEDRSPEQRVTVLNSYYLNLENSEKKFLFTILSSKIPFLSASDNAERVLLCDYSGLTLEFFTTLKLWSNGVFLNLTNPLLDGDREYKNGKGFHKTEADIDRSGRRIVFEYENKIYLIDIKPDVAFEDLAAANLKNPRG
jgi:uncharacterized protein YjbI with pentapeptide repeats